MVNIVKVKKKLRDLSMLPNILFSFLRDIFIFIISNLFNIITFKYDMGIVTTI